MELNFKEIPRYHRLINAAYEFLEKNVHEADLEHYWRVAGGFPRDTRLCLLALLHDIGEDYENLFPQLCEISELDASDIEVLRAVTRNSGEEYFVYIERISKNTDATCIKLADLHENMKRCVRDLPERLSSLKRYVKAYEILWTTSRTSLEAFTSVAVGKLRSEA